MKNNKKNKETKKINSKNPIYDMITIGGATIDIFVKPRIDVKNNKICFELGDKLKISSIYHSSGGGGTNTAVGFSRFGFKTGCLVTIGNDFYGKEILEDLNKNKVDFLGNIINKKTGLSIIIDNSKIKDRVILTYRGANEYLNLNKLKHTIHESKWFFIGSLTGKSFYEISYIIKRLKKSLNKNYKDDKKNNKKKNKKYPKIAINPSQFMINKYRTKILAMIKYFDILIMNLKEAQLLTKINLNIKKQKNEKIKNNIELITKIFEYLRNKNKECIYLITNGKQGAYALYNDVVYFINARKVKVKENSGAGDAFSCGFVSGIIKGYSIKQSLEIGAFNAESVIQYLGAKNKLLNFNEIKELKKVFKHKIKIIKKF